MTTVNNIKTLTNPIAMQSDVFLSETKLLTNVRKTGSNT